jgi:hypothetical protein
MLDMLSAEDWMKKLEDPISATVIPRRLENPSNSLPQSLVESADSFFAHPKTWEGEDLRSDYRF